MTASPRKNRLTATFEDRDLERQFWEYWNVSFIGKDRAMLYAAVGVYALYAFLDIFTLTEAQPIVMSLRFIMVFCAIWVIHLTYFDFGKRHLQSICMILMLMAGLSVCFMIWLAGGISPPYYIGLIMTAMIMTNLVRVSVVTSVGVLATLYIGFTMATRNFPSSIDLIAAHLFTVNSFLLSVISNYFLELRRRDEFVQHRENIDYSHQLQGLYDDANRSIKRKNAVLNTLTHVFKTPLHQIIGYAQMLERESLGPHSVPEYTEFSGNIHNAGIDMLRLVQRLLTYSRLDAGTRTLKRQRTTTDEIIECALSRLEEAITAKKLTVTMPETCLRFNVDGGLLEQAYYEIFENAVEASPQNGSIDIDTQLADGTIRMVVTDEGTGIDLTRLEQIADTLEHTDEFLGTGGKISLGITLANRIVASHDGSISFSHTDKGGTQVVLALPEEALAEPAPVSDPEDSTGSEVAPEPQAARKSA